MWVLPHRKKDRKQRGLDLQHENEKEQKKCQKKDILKGKAKYKKYQIKECGPIWEETPIEIRIAKKKIETNKETKKRKKYMNKQKV